MMTSNLMPLAELHLAIKVHMSAIPEDTEHLINSVPEKKILVIQAETRSPLVDGIWHESILSLGM
jgi:hypothetical protein